MAQIHYDTQISLLKSGHP